jgi:hypothetical protein
LPLGLRRRRLLLGLRLRGGCRLRVLGGERRGEEDAGQADSESEQTRHEI